MQISKKLVVLMGVLGLAAGTAGTIALQTHAAGITAAASTSGKTRMRGTFTPPAAAGKVTSVNGSTITVTDIKSGTSYTVNVGNATIQKITAPTTSGTKVAPQTIAVSGIVVGDNVTVQGTVSGTTINATKITDGSMGGLRGPPGTRAAVGTVSAISGNTITLTGKNGTTYTIDASSSSVEKVSSSSVSSIAVGDNLMVNGTISGNSVTAKNIVDGSLGMGTMWK